MHFPIDLPFTDPRWTADMLRAYRDARLPLHWARCASRTGRFTCDLEAASAGALDATIKAQKSLDPSLQILATSTDDSPSPVATWKRRVRVAVKIIAIIATPIFVAQTLGLVSYIYHESLQAATFAANIAIDSRDTTIAVAAVRTARDLMYRAQHFQRRIGCLAFWANEAYEQSFFVAAPAQLAALHAKGKRNGIWQDPPDRWQYRSSPKGDIQLADTWQDDPLNHINEPPIIDPRPHHPDPLGELRRQGRSILVALSSADCEVSP